MTRKLTARVYATMASEGVQVDATLAVLEGESVRSELERLKRMWPDCKLVRAKVVRQN